jgi:potassium efflux system protein
METESIFDVPAPISIDESLEIVSEQFKVVGIYLDRPIVQRQLLLVVLILFAAWAIPTGLRYWLSRRTSARPVPEVWRRRFEGAYLVIAPILGLVLTQIAISAFQILENPYGILLETRTALWYWLAYRGLLAWLYARYGAAFSPFHHRIFLPLFLLLMGSQLSANFVNLRLVSELPLFTVFDTTITLRRLFAAFVILYGFSVAAWVSALAIRRTMGERSAIDPGVIESVVTISRYAIIGTGLLLALYILGVDLSTLALIGGGLSIGVGFGLQNIIANFISGLVLLFEQAVLPGDIIDIGGRIGTVEQVNIRATTVRTFDNVEVLVPNQNFMNSEVTTFTKTDDRIRILLPVGVSYDSDPEMVRRVACATAQRHGLVLDEPKPRLFFCGFGSSSLDFELAAWIDEPQRSKSITSDLYYMLWNAFAESGIEIPYPQRDLNLRRGWDRISPETQGGGTAPIV